MTTKIKLTKKWQKIFDDTSKEDLMTKAVNTIYFLAFRYTTPTQKLGREIIKMILKEDIGGKK